NPVVASGRGILIPPAPATLPDKRVGPGSAGPHFERDPGGSAGDQVDEVSTGVLSHDLDIGDLGDAGVIMACDLDALRTAVAELVAGELADQAIEVADLVQPIAESLLADTQGAVVPDHADLADAREDEHRGVVGVSVERSGRSLTVGLLVGGDHLGVGLSGGAHVALEVEVRTGEVPAHRLRDLDEALDEQAVGADEDRVFETGDALTLLGDLGTTRLREDRHEHDLGRVRGHLGEESRLILALLAGGGGLQRDFTAESLERLDEGVDQTLGVGVTVVDRNSLGLPELVVDEAGDRSALEQVVVSGPVVALEVLRTGIPLEVRG